MARTRHAVVLLVLGMLTAQAAWLLAVPAFRGIDEFDHVYRAASVARGQWLPSGVQAAHGRGELVTVPSDIVAAAGPECRARPYTGHDNCAPVADEAGARVRVATAAARYEPVYYWVVGTAARWAHGTAADYAMRIVSAVLCALFTGLAGWAVSRWARTRWPLAAVVASLTPVVVYSSIVVAPNALEMAVATSTWAALAGLATDDVEPRTERWLLCAAVPGAVLLANLRSLGIGFLALVLLAVAAVLGPRRLRSLVSRQRSTLLAAGAVVLMAVCAVFALGQLVAVLHVLAQQRQVSPSVALGLWSPPSPWLVGVLTLGGWLLVGAFVLRHEPRLDTARGAARLRSAWSCSPRRARRRAARGTTPRR